MTLGVHLIKSTNDYEKGLEEWIDLPRAAKTWLHFKTHFTTAQEKLRKMRGPSMKNASFSNTANAITSTVINSVRAELSDDRDRVFQRLDETENSIINALTASSGSASTQSDDDDTSISGLTQKANAVKGDAVQLEILKILKQIKSDMKTCKEIDDDDSGRQPKRKRGKR